MVVLKSKYKIKGSTLMETLVATVVIVIIFMMASLILNNLFSNTIKNNTQSIDSYLNELQYKKQNDHFRTMIDTVVQPGGSNQDRHGSTY